LPDNKSEQLLFETEPIIKGNEDMKRLTPFFKGNVISSRLMVIIPLLLLYCNSLLASDNDRVALKVTVIDDDIELDGILSEPCWQTSEAIQGLTMLEPIEGNQASQNTWVSVAANKKYLIIGIYCYDNPQKIVTFSKGRDASLRNEDHVKIVIDPFQNGRTGYVFAVNPVGSRYDALVSNQGESENEDWDAIWNAEAQIHADGWSAEIRIPIQSLNYDNSLKDWGFNVERRIQRLLETDRWSSPELDYEFTQTSRAGLLQGMPDFDTGLGLSVRPAVVARASITEVGAPVEYSSEPSFEIQQLIGSNIQASVSINTDFAETEADNRRTNLTRFSIFFPEKRTFFLEGADIFEFGLGLGSDIIPFFSRRIGLSDGQEVPIVVGGKINGRINDTNFGFLTVRTGEADGISPASTRGVVRVKQNFLRESTFGFIGTVGDPQDISGSYMYGVDFTYQTSRFNGDKNFLAGVWGTLAGRSDLEGDKAAFGFKIDYPNDLWDVALTYKRIGEAYDPSLGFVPRRNVQHIRLGATYAPRPSWRGVRQIRNELFLTMVTNMDFEWESYRLFTAPFNWRFESGERAEFNVVPQGERIPEPFEIAEGVIIEPGEYNWVRFRLEGDLAAKRKFSGRFSWWFGGFYGGNLHTVEARVNFRPSPTTTLEISGQRNIGDLPFGSFTQDLISSTISIDVSSNLQFNSLIQYDNETRSVGTNTRVRWIFHPLGDFFLVYNHNIRDIENRWVKDSNQLIFKVQYTFRA
jgi:hypothetical protein